MDYKDIDLETHKKNRLYHAGVLASYNEGGYVHNKHECPSCLTMNWLYQGDLDDCTQPDREGCKCGKCGHKFFAMDPEYISEFFFEEFDEVKGDLQKLIEMDVGFFEEGKLEAPYDRK